MLHRTIVLFLSLSVFLGTFAASGFAQNRQSNDEKQTNKIRLKIEKLGVGESAKVKAKLYNGTTYQGHVKEAGPDTFVIVDKAGSPNTVKYSDIKSIGGKNLSTGAKIAVGVAIGVGATLGILFWIVAHLD
ncbi:MAG: hypothetical protein WBO10_08820 [Pyrinomonadaceae bacterium]